MVDKSSAIFHIVVVAVAAVAILVMLRLNHATFRRINERRHTLHLHFLERINSVVKGSEYSIPGKETADSLDYAPVYFMAYEDSSLRLSTTVYYESSTPSEVLISDINLRVNKALSKNGIEIPYAYMNVIEHRGK